MARSCFTYVNPVDSAEATNYAIIGQGGQQGRCARTGEEDTRRAGGLALADSFFTGCRRAVSTLRQAVHRLVIHRYRHILRLRRKVRRQSGHVWMKVRLIVRNSVKIAYDYY